MNLYDFVDHIPNRILDRGYEYWLDGRVVVESERESTYHLTAEGSETYELLITLSGIDIVDSSCDCPYTKGHCKHEVAVYFLLREKVAVPSNRNVRQQLQKLTKQQLVNLLVGLANDPELYPRIARSFDTSRNRSLKSSRKCAVGSAIDSPCSNLTILRCRTFSRSLMHGLVMCSLFKIMR